MRELEYRLEIIAQSAVKVYIASHNRRYYYPYRLQGADQAREWARASSLELIIDSAINNPDIGNEETLDRAHDLNADYVIPADVCRDQDATTESVTEFLEIYETHPCTATPIIPLQPPYDRHYRALSGYSHYALGGIANRPPSEQIEAIRRFRDEAGWRPHAHGLGLGASITLIRALRDDPSLLDSLDLSTPEQMVINDQIADKTWTQRRFRYPRGEDSTTLRAAYASALALQLNYMLSPICDDDELESIYEQSRLSNLE